MSTSTTEKMIDRQELILPVLQEELEVYKQTVPTGLVRIRKTVREREEVVDEPLLAHAVEIVRVAKNQVVDAVIPIRQEGDTTVISIVEEALLLTKQLVWKEEIRITNRVSETREPQHMILRTEEVSIERGRVKDGLLTNAPIASIATATAADFKAFQEGALELIETAEEGMISKVAHVIEEIVVSKQVFAREQTVNDTLRHTEIHTESILPSQGD